MKIISNCFQAGQRVGQCFQHKKCVRQKIIAKKRVLTNLCHHMVVFCLFLTSSAYSSDATNKPTDLVAFFKQAINSPPEIERYIVKRTNLQLPTGQVKDGSHDSSSFQYFEGAISGTNFFLHYLPDPDQPIDTNHLGIISARSGFSTYEIGGHGLIKGIGNNGLTENVEANFRVSRQILGMGAGEVEPETVKWIGNNFTATNVVGKGVHGSLLVSNNLPIRMEISLDGSSVPYQVIEYAYPTPDDLFAGYPAKLLISYKFKVGLEPLAEIDFKSVVLATQKLSFGFFDEARFAERIGYINVHSNSDYYTAKTRTNQFIKLNSYVDSGGFTNSHSRMVVYGVLILVTIFPAAYLLILSVRKTNKQKTK